VWVERRDRPSGVEDVDKRVRATAIRYTVYLSFRPRRRGLRMSWIPFERSEFVLPLSAVADRSVLARSPTNSIV